MVDGFDSMYCREFLSHVLLHATDTWLKAVRHKFESIRGANLCRTNRAMTHSLSCPSPKHSRSVIVPMESVYGVLDTYMAASVRNDSSLQARVSDQTSLLRSSSY